MTGALLILAVFWVAVVVSVFVLELRTAVIFAGMWVAGWFIFGFLPNGHYIFMVYEVFLGLTLITMVKDGK